MQDSKITIDGCQYQVDVHKMPNITSISVIDVDENVVGVFEISQSVELALATYFFDASPADEVSVDYFEFAEKTSDEIASWLVSTHPING